MGMETLQFFTAGTLLLASICLALFGLFTLAAGIFTDREHLERRVLLIVAAGVVVGVSGLAVNTA